ncbi:DUF4342 domain-containing protein [Actinomycetaceae bacterium MB13-C1-2]|nr:DUF4342 domain-containing protein [Actinomycetaceae bacterium MB13-C1-2]
MSNAQSFSEKFADASDQLSAKVKELIEEGNVRRIIVRNAEGTELLNLPLNGGAIVGGVLALAAPLVATVGAVATLASPLKVEIVRVNEDDVEVTEFVQITGSSETDPVDEEVQDAN